MSQLRICFVLFMMVFASIGGRCGYVNYGMVG